MRYTKIHLAKKQNPTLLLSDTSSEHRRQHLDSVTETACNTQEKQQQGFSLPESLGVTSLPTKIGIQGLQTHPCSPLCAENTRGLFLNMWAVTGFRHLWVLWGFRHQFCQPDPASFQDRNQQWVLLIWVVSYHFLLSICRLQRQQDIYFSLSPAKIAKLLFSSSEKLELIPVIQRVL